MNPELRQQIISDFVNYCKQRLEIETDAPIQFTEDNSWAKTSRSFGSFDPRSNHIVIYIGNRNLADILRTLAHELVHHKQRELGMINSGADGITGSGIENQANALAGVLMRDYGKTNQLIYESCLPTLKQIYEVEDKAGLQIYCDMDGVLCDFDSRFEYYFDMSPNKFREQYGKQVMEDKVSEAGLQFWAGMDWMPGGEALWAVIGKRNTIILSSPGKFYQAEEGKKLWIANHLSPQPKDIIFKQAGKKHEVLQGKSPDQIKKSILIDDYYRNIMPWKEVGGIGLYYKSTPQVLDILAKFRIK